MVAATASLCTIGIQATPAGVELDSLSLSAESGCHVEIDGASMLGVSGTLDWASGVIGVPLTLEATATATIGADGAVARQLAAPMLIAGAMRLQNGTISEAAPASMTVTGTFTGSGTVEGDLTNTSGTVKDAGTDYPLVITGAYTQERHATLVLVIDSEAYYEFSVGGATTVSGRVEYLNRHYSPAGHSRAGGMFGGLPFNWAPTCRITRGTESHLGHWKGVRGEDPPNGFIKLHWEPGAQRSC